MFSRNLRTGVKVFEKVTDRCFRESLGALKTAVNKKVCIDSRVCTPQCTKLKYLPTHQSIHLSIFPPIHLTRGNRGGGANRGAPLLDFYNLKRKSTVTHHSNRKGTRRKMEKEIYRYWSYDGQGPPPPPLLP